MLNKWINTFIQLGLSEVESKIYFAGLELGPTSAQELARKASVSRTATYDAINALKGKGLLSTFQKGAKTVFTIEQPEDALRYFRKQSRQMRDKIELMEEAVPEMKSLSPGEKPFIRFYEGPEALRNLFADVQAVNPPSIYEFVNIQDVYHSVHDGTPEVKKIFAEAHNVSDPSRQDIRLLHTGNVRENYQHRKGVAFRQLNNSFGEFHGDIWIYGDRVVFTSFKGSIMAIIIQSEMFSQTARVMFEAAWSISK
ncbi:hypothetical protein COV06_01965 [Candidatus Uhrbacteria bacterium CG10_big_fil_rev_8_21_14_0_10_50_16]|uniref:Transcription regulator TrmB N-terminal domain-containing protein n=1 Tax=Candidatus Uhrbacteria bacterium CG10_big_fil_rev_8_21_14_0_10_50_16 TaxID=1975039 RepID=A0A2H0RMK8_9BACT|nr:MAG: hypothetical protein COV06_01965 [Candidatus Uhrbacteria bacterium CG10_big_fil_rev_8_21_14_0_10_50_16]